MEAILVTPEVSKFIRFKDIKELHLENIFFMFFTLDVFIFLIVKVFKEEQP